MQDNICRQKISFLDTLIFNWWINICSYPSCTSPFCRSKNSICIDVLGIEMGLSKDQLKIYGQRPMDFEQPEPNLGQKRPYLTWQCKFFDRCLKGQFFFILTLVIFPFLLDRTHEHRLKYVFLKSKHLQTHSQQPPLIQC